MPRPISYALTLAALLGGACGSSEPACVADCGPRDAGLDAGSVPTDAGRDASAPRPDAMVDGGDGIRDAAVDGGPMDDDLCREVYGVAPTDPSFRAFGFERHEVEFETIWDASPGESAPSRGVPGIYLDPAEGRYLAIPIVMDDDSGGARSQVRMSWVETQPTGHPSLNVPTGAVSITVSPCPGDFRPPGGLFDADPYLRPSCRRGPGISGNMEITTVDGLSGCRIPRGRRVYLNIAAYDMFSGPPTESRCVGASTCGVSLRML